MTRKFAFIPRKHPSAAAFTLMETVIAIGVLAVLLTGFIAVFTPAAQGIRRSISSQQADRLTSTLERELVTLRTGQTPTATTGFEKGFTWLKEGNSATNPKAIFVYQYRGNPASIRTDGTMAPMASISGQPGKEYIVQSMARRIGETAAEKKIFQDDLEALEGSIFFVKPTQLVFETTAGETKMVLGTPGVISYLENGAKTDAPTAADYKEAVIPFSAEFHGVPTKSYSYLTGTEFQTLFTNVKNPVFTRNLAICR